MLFFQIKLSSHKVGYQDNLIFAFVRLRHLLRLPQQLEQVLSSETSPTLQTKTVDPGRLSIKAASNLIHIADASHRHQRTS